MLDRMVQWVKEKSFSNPVTFGFTAGIVLGAIWISLFLIFPWLTHYDDPRWQEFSGASLILFLVVANRQYVKRLRFWVLLTAVAFAHLAVLSIFTKLIAHPRPEQYFLLTYVDILVGEWIVRSMREQAPA